MKINRFPYQQACQSFWARTSPALIKSFQLTFKYSNSRLTPSLIHSHGFNYHSELMSPKTHIANTDFFPEPEPCLCCSEAPQAPNAQQVPTLDSPSPHSGDPLQASLLLPSPDSLCVLTNSEPIPVLLLSFPLLL